MQTKKMKNTKTNKQSRTQVQIAPLRALRLQVDRTSDYTSFEARKRMAALRRTLPERQEAHTARIAAHNKV